MNADTSAALPSAASTNISHSIAPASALPVPIPTSHNTTPSSRPPPLQIEASLGVIEVLPEREQIVLTSLELAIDDSITQGWKCFIDIGLALIEIKANQLYRADFRTFEEYCQVRWDFQHSKANYLMSAAQLVKSIAALPDLPKPERESPLRPMLKLAPQDVQRVWKLAVERTGGRPITARAVKNAMRELQLHGPQRANHHQARHDRSKRRETISGCIGELLTLIANRAGYDILTQKVEALHGHLQFLFTPPGSRK